MAGKNKNQAKEVEVTLNKKGESRVLSIWFASHFKIYFLNSFSLVRVTHYS